MSSEVQTEPEKGEGSGPEQGNGAAEAEPTESAPEAAAATPKSTATPSEVSLEAIAEATQASLVSEIMEEIQVDDDELREELTLGLTGFLKYLLRADASAERVDTVEVDLLIAELTQKMTGQVDEILHHRTFQAIEAAWRSLKFVVDRVEFRENTQVAFLNVSKMDLLEDFQDSPEITKSGLYRIVYSAEYGQFGGRPWGLLVANYEFSPLPQDMALIADCAAVATMSHAPFIAGASPAFFGLDDWLNLPQLSELQALFAGPQYTKWQAFRDSDDSRYVALCMPRFLLRLPYGPHSNRVGAFEYEEQVVGHHERYLWGNAAFAFATRVAEAFARYRFCVNIIGPSTGGTVEHLVLHEYEAMGRIQTKIPTEIVVTERREFELSQQGFIPLTYRPDTDNACFYSASSCQKPKTFGISEEGREAELNHRLGTQLPYLFMICRLAHYLKVMQRENIGTWKERKDLELEMNKWIAQYVANQDIVSTAVRARRPLRSAKVKIEDVPGNAGWYRIDLRIRPHFRYMGAVFHLGLVGKMEQE